MQFVDQTIANTVLTLAQLSTGAANADLALASTATLQTAIDGLTSTDLSLATAITDTSTGLASQLSQAQVDHTNALTTAIADFLPSSTISLTLAQAVAPLASLPTLSAAISNQVVSSASMATAITTNRDFASTLASSVTAVQSSVSSTASALSVEVSTRTAQSQCGDQGMMWSPSASKCVLATIQLKNDNSISGCNDSTAGLLRYNAQLGNVEVCHQGNWQGMSNGANQFKSCLEVKEATGASTDGYVTLYRYGKPYKAWCDFTTEGGGECELQRGGAEKLASGSFLRTPFTGNPCSPDFLNIGFKYANQPPLDVFLFSL